MSDIKQYHLIFNHLQVLTSKDALQYASEMMEHPYSDDKGWGFTDVIRMGDEVNATLQKRIPTYYSIWNEELQQVERQLVQVVKEIPFEMDFNRHLLIAEGTNTQLNHLKQSFRQVFWNEFVYEAVELMPVDYVQMLSDSSMLCSIDELTINDFQYEGCLIGRYIAKPTNQLNIKSHLSENAQRIIRAKMTLNIGDEKCRMVVNNRNVLAIESSETAENVLLNFLIANIR